MRNSEKLTMDTIATQLNVSKTTVSRAISGKGRIGRETREKILNYISSRGYKPNTMARALAGSRTYNIGVVIPDNEGRGEAPFFKECLVGITEASARRDYDTLLAVTSGDNFENLERLVTAQKVDGVVVTRGDSGRQMISYLNEHNMPFILIGSDDDENVFQIDSDQKDACCELTARMIKRTPAKIALFAGPKDMDIERLRYDGFKQAFVLADTQPDESLVFWDCEKKLEKNLDKAIEAGVQCVACSDDMICLKVIDSLKKRGISVPEQMQIVSFFDSEALAGNKVPVTALHVETKAMSAKAADLLIDILNGNRPDRRNYSKCSVLYRDSFR